MKKNDLKLMGMLLIITIILFIGWFIYVNSNNNYNRVNISINGKEIFYSLDKNDIITLENGIQLKINDKKVRVIYSPCKNQICVKHKPIHNNKEQIVCLPNNTIITIDNNKNTEYDGIVN